MLHITNNIVVVVGDNACGGWKNDSRRSKGYFQTKKTSNLRGALLILSLGFLYISYRNSIQLACKW